MSGEREDDPRADVAEWATDFRAATGGPEVPSADVILERAARDARRARLEWASQIGGTVFAVAVFLGLVVRTRSLLMTGFAAFVLPTLFTLFAFFVYLRIGAAKAAGASVADHVAAATRRNEARHRVARASLAALVLLATGFWIWLPLLVHSRGERFAAEPWRLAVAVVAALVVFGLGLVRAATVVRRARAELESWRAVAASLKEPPES